MDALQNDLTCPEMRDACNGSAYPQIETCKHIQNPAEENTLESVAIALSEHMRIVAYLQKQLELCADVPDGLLSMLTLLNADMQNNINSLCAMQEKAQ